MLDAGTGLLRLVLTRQRGCLNFLTLKVESDFGSESDEGVFDEPDSGLASAEFPSWCVLDNREAWFRFARWMDQESSEHYGFVRL